MSGHTPGPWRVINEGTLVVADNSCGHGLMTIADVRVWRHLTGLGACWLLDDAAIAIQDANGRLIAAAPDLLASAEAVVEQWHTPNWKLTAPTAEKIQALEAAIRKAKGE